MEGSCGAASFSVIVVTAVGHTYAGDRNRQLLGVLWVLRYRTYSRAFPALQCSLPSLCSGIVTGLSDVCFYCSSVCANTKAIEVLN